MATKKWPTVQPQGDTPQQKTITKGKIPEYVLKMGGGLGMLAQLTKTGIPLKKQPVEVTVEGIGSAQDISPIVSNNEVNRSQFESEWQEKQKTLLTVMPLNQDHPILKKNRERYETSQKKSEEEKNDKNITIYQPPEVPTVEGHTDYRSVLRKAKENKEQEQLRIAEEERKQEMTKLKIEDTIRREREEEKKREAERIAKEEAELKVKQEIELKAKEEAELKSKEETERLEAEKLACEEEKRKSKEEEERLALEEQERKTKEEAELKMKENSKPKNKSKKKKSHRHKTEDGTVVKAKEETELKAKKEAEVKAKEEERKAKEETELKAKKEAELKAKEELELKKKQESELKAKKEAELRAKEEEEHRAKQEAELQAKEKAELKATVGTKQESKQESSKVEKKSVELLNIPSINTSQEFSKLPVSPRKSFVTPRSKISNRLLGTLSFFEELTQDAGLPRADLNKPPSTKIEKKSESKPSAPFFDGKADYVAKPTEDSGITYVAYEELIKKPINLVRTQLEAYLTDEEFAKVFHMQKVEFYSLPKWKQIDLKRLHKLF